MASPSRRVLSAADADRYTPAQVLDGWVPAQQADVENPPTRTRVSRSTEASASEWSSTPAVRVEELFIGRFPGVQVFGSGSGISVRIRGATSVYGSNQPLYVIDGFPMEPDPQGLIGINPADVAKIEVLKDIGATSYYGVRGANGVIVITTKRR